MADNISVTQGAGSVIAADDVGGALHQRIKMTWGQDGVGNDVDTAPGKLLPVQLRSAAGVELSLATAAQVGEVQASPTANTLLDRIKSLLTGIVLAAGTNLIGKVGIDQTTPGTTNGVVSFPSVDQDPIFNHTAGTKTSVSASATIITPPSGCKYVRIVTDIDIVVNTAGAAAVDNGTAVRILANVPEIIPVVASTAVLALSLGAAATVRVTPLKVR